MESQIEGFKDRQQTLLTFIQASATNKPELLAACKSFLINQKQQVSVLEESRKTHMNERGKLDYRLAAEEKVSLATLKNLYSSFAKPLEDFLQLLARISKSTSSRELTCFKMEALDLVKEMVKICAILDKQPVCTNYEKQKNESPNLILLGVHCLSNIEVSNLLLNAVSEADLYSASRDGLSLESVGGFQGFNVKQQVKQSKTSNSKANQKSDCISKNLGTWSIQKDQLNAMEKGSAHKDFLRLRYTFQIKYSNINENLMLLSLPFNIRKSSCQLFTFTGALMWYFYNTDMPYETFNVTDRLPLEKVVKMLTTRIEVIGRQVSPRAQDFLTDRISNLSSNGRVELETLAKGPSTNKEDHARPPDKTRTEDEAIECYGFFTWFFALVKSLDIGGYLNKLWTYGHIYDICDFKCLEGMIQQAQFGFQTTVLRPSMSAIAKYQGEDINMGLAFFFKQYPNHDKVFSLNLSMEEVKSHGLYKLLTRLPVEFICLKDDVQCGLEVLDSHTVQAVSQDKLYHGTRFQMASAVQLSDTDARPKHCCTCRCDREDANSVCSQESQAKKVRTPSGNSDQMSSVSDWQSTNLPHKQRETNSMSSSIEDWTVQKNNGFQCIKDEQAASPSQMTSFSSPRSHREWPEGSPDSGVPVEDHNLQGFDFLMMTDDCNPEPSSQREQLISNCRQAFNAFSSINFSNLSDEEIKLVTSILLGSQQTIDNQITDQITNAYNGQANDLSDGNDTQGFLPIGYQVISTQNCTEQLMSSPTMVTDCTEQSISSPTMVTSCTGKLMCSTGIVANDLSNCLSELEDGVGNLMSLADLNQDSPFV